MLAQRFCKTSGGANIAAQVDVAERRAVAAQLASIGGDFNFDWSKEFKSPHFSLQKSMTLPAFSTGVHSRSRN
jgi:hypothetical protein